MYYIRAVARKYAILSYGVKKKGVPLFYHKKELLNSPLLLLVSPFCIHP